MGHAEIQVPMGDGERYVRLFDETEHVAYVARYCVLCNQWMNKEDGWTLIVEGATIGFVCRLHDREAVNDSGTPNS